MKRILKYFAAGIIVAIGGMFFSDLAGIFFNGMPYGDAVTLGIGMYLCIVIVTCTGIIVFRLDKNFEVKHQAPNAETKAALDEYEEMKKHPDRYKRYESFDEVLDDV